ncbi:MAG TPA: DUF4870 domain-containing protein [Perlabentimonas sp.]|jgi:uncharacterized Tic20 family protein|nr:DUF4870 domain-containing protein [Tenuifilaceae bacterium]HZJ74822.1 DUF4870 domain-containing protein [Perlabentimonas sp.]
MEHINYINSEERTMAMLCHLSALAMFLVPFGRILGPLVVWLIKKDQYVEVDRQGKDALNFQISIFLYMIISSLFIIILIGVFMLAALGIFSLGITIVASVKANNGERFIYPLAIRFIQ